MKKSKKWIIPTLVVLLLGAGGSAYAWMSGNETARDDAPTYQEVAYQQAVLQREKTVSQRSDAIKNELARLDPLTQQVESAQRKYDSMRSAP